MERNGRACGNCISEVRCEMKEAMPTWPQTLLITALGMASIVCGYFLSRMRDDWSPSAWAVSGAAADLCDGIRGHVACSSTCALSMAPGRSPSPSSSCWVMARWWRCCGGSGCSVKETDRRQRAWLWG